VFTARRIDDVVPPEREQTVTAARIQETASAALYVHPSRVETSAEKLAAERSENPVFETTNAPPVSTA